MSTKHLLKKHQNNNDNLKIEEPLPLFLNQEKEHGGLQLAVHITSGMDSVSAATE